MDEHIGADKSRATMVFDELEYNNKMQILLIENITYFKLDKDPTSKLKKELVSMLQELEKTGVRSEREVNNSCI